jgi:hypothetical protein
MKETSLILHSDNGTPMKSLSLYAVIYLITRTLRHIKNTNDIVLVFMHVLSRNLNYLRIDFRQKTSGMKRGEWLRLHCSLNYISMAEAYGWIDYNSTITGNVAL